DQHADAEVANLQAADLDALGVDQSEAGIAGRAHVGAVLAGDGAGAGLRALVLDVAGAVQSDEFAAALPRRALDRHRTFARRQRRGELDHVRRLTRGIELDAQAPGRRVVGLDRPAQRAFAAVIGGAGDAQHLGRRCRRALRAGMIWNRPKRNGREVTNGTCRHMLLPKFIAAVTPHSPDGPFPRACTSRIASARRRAILAYAGHITTPTRPGNSTKFSATASTPCDATCVHFIELTCCLSALGLAPKRLHQDWRWAGCARTTQTR